MTVRAALDRGVRPHTPGPWKADPKRLMIETRQGLVEGPVMSYLSGGKHTAPGMTVSIASERHADHYLCAAAPDLLAALETVKRVLQGDRAFDIMLSESGPCLGDVVRDAIEKARGP